MKSHRAFRLFCSQLERHITSGSFATKVVPLPSSVSEKGVHIRVAVLKPTRAAKPSQMGSPPKMVRLRVSVAGSAESMTGLEQAMDAVEALDTYLMHCDTLRLEDEEGKAIADTRLMQKVSPEDSFLDSPDSTAVQDVQDDRTITIYFPGEEDE